MPPSSTRCIDVLAHTRRRCLLTFRRALPQNNTRAIHEAAYKGQYDTILALLEGKADITLKDKVSVPTTVSPQLGCLRTVI